MSVTAGYYRRQFYNIAAEPNLAVDPNLDYTPFTVVGSGSPAASSMPWSAIFKSNGLMTPPTQWATWVGGRFGFAVVAVPGGCGVGGYGVPNHDFVGSDEDFLDEEPQDPLAVFDGGGGGLVAQLGEEGAEVGGEGEVCLLVGVLGGEVVELGAELFFAGAQFGGARA